ncbi:MAG TPA: lipase family protein, partial [Oceanipulchritudo sp.]|nr:lipase family protein [Oceanipulchritudo sp.]
VRMKSGGTEHAEGLNRTRKTEKETVKEDSKEGVFLLPKLSRDGQLRASISALRTPPPGFSAMAASVLAGLSSRAYEWTAGKAVINDRTGGEWTVTNLGHVSGGHVETDPDDFQPDTQVFAVESSDRSVLVLVFRGTEPNRLPDIWTNLKFEREPLPSGLGNVHRGFLGALNANTGEREKALQEILEEKVQPFAEGKALFWVTGHSLGGALAHLFVARWLAANSARKRHLAGSYTFGAPRIGDKAFARFLDTTSPGRVVRLVNDLDLVPRVPFASQGFQHTKAYFRFDAAGDLILGERFLVRVASMFLERLKDRKVVTFRSMSGELLGDHSIDEYHRLCTAVVNRHGDIQTRPLTGEVARSLPAS